MKLLALLALAALVLAAGCGSADETAAPASTGAETRPTALPSLARVVCDAEGVRVETPAVKPRKDGLHLEIVNEAGAERALSLSGEDTGLGFGVPPGTTLHVTDTGPGTVTVSCDDPAAEPGAGVPLEVVDEDGVWVATGLACEEVFSAVLDYVAGAEGETADPLAAAREAMEGYGVEPEDVYERAGYPDAETLKVRVVRDGEPLAIVDLVDDGGGKWLVSTLTGCGFLQN